MIDPWYSFPSTLGVRIICLCPPPGAQASFLPDALANFPSSLSMAYNFQFLRVKIDTCVLMNSDSLLIIASHSQMQNTGGRGDFWEKQ